MMRVLTALSLVFIFCRNGYSQTSEVLTAFQKLGTNPILDHFTYTGPLPSGEGHLQGVQSILSDEQPNYVLTGSSGRFAYCLVTHQGTSSNMQMLDSFPYRHAGGFQLLNHTLVVGVEDNIAKNKSEIVLGMVSDTGCSVQHEVVKSRSGTFKRSTAGATAACSAPAYGMLVAVGDWDTRNIDFYRSGANNACDSFATYHVPDSLQWPAYQSINLARDSSGIYLLGFCNSGNRNRADLYKMDMAERGVFTFKLLVTRHFVCRKGASFRYGAGLNYTKGSLQLYATQRRLKHCNTIAVYK